MDELLINIVPLLVLVTIGYLNGSRVEKKHYRSIVKRENRLLGLPVVTVKRGSYPRRDI